LGSDGAMPLGKRPANGARAGKIQGGPTSFSRLKDTATVNRAGTSIHSLDRVTTGIIAGQLSQIEDLLNVIEAAPDSHMADEARRKILKSKQKAASYLVTKVVRGEIGGVERILALDRELVNKTDNLGRTPLQIACNFGRLDIVEFLLERGADIDEDTLFGGTPLQIACDSGKLDVVKFLLKNGADVNKAENDPDTPLLIACNNGHLDIVKLLLSKEGVDVNKEDSLGQTPLLIACGNGHLDIVKLLLEKEGVDVNKADDDGLTPLNVARGRGWPVIVNLLEKARDTADDDAMET